MTGSTMALMGASSGALTGTAASVTNTNLSPGVRTGTLSFLNDGTFTATGSSTANWFNPTTSGIGAVWWVKVAASGSNTSFGGSALNTWFQISSLPAFTISNSSSTTEAVGSGTISYSPDGGTTTAGTASLTFGVGYTP